MRTTAVVHSAATTTAADLLHHPPITGSFSSTTSSRTLGRSTVVISPPTPPPLLARPMLVATARAGRPERTPRGKRSRPSSGAWGHHEDGSLALGRYGGRLDDQFIQGDCAAIPEDRKSSPDTRKASGSQAVMDQPLKTYYGTDVGEQRQADGALPDKANELSQPAHLLDGNPLEETHADGTNASMDCSTPTGGTNSKGGYEGIYTGSKSPRICHVSPAFDRPSSLSIF